MSQPDPRRRFVIHAFASLAVSTAACKHHEGDHAPAPVRSLTPVASDPMPRPPTPPAPPTPVATPDAGSVAALQVDAGGAIGADAASLGIFAALAGGGGSLAGGPAGGRMGGGGTGTIGLGNIGTMGGPGQGYGGGGRMGIGNRAQPPLVRAAPPTVTGLLSPEAIRRVTLRNLGQVSHCHEQGLARNPNAEGRVVIRFIISGTGDVIGSSVAESSYPIPAVAECVASAVRRWHFPSPEGGGIVTVNYPFNFQHPS